MESISLTSLAAEKLSEAQKSHSGRAAHTIHGGHTHELRQTVLALLAGHDLSEHDSPGEATLQVLQGHVALRPAATLGTARSATTSRFRHNATPCARSRIRWSC
jgi:hypothetical protein